VQRADADREAETQRGEHVRVREKEARHHHPVEEALLAALCAEPTT